jgi:hypothetical protein
MAAQRTEDVSRAVYLRPPGVVIQSPDDPNALCDAINHGLVQSNLKTTQDPTTICLFFPFELPQTAQPSV